MAPPTHAARGGPHCPRTVTGPWLSASSAINIMVCRYRRLLEALVRGSEVSNCDAMYSSHARLGFAGGEFALVADEGFDRTAAYSASRSASRTVIDAAANLCRSRGLEWGSSGNVGCIRL